MTNRRDDDDTPTTYASPPCFMHEVDPAYSGSPVPNDPQRHSDVLRWRKAERERLIAKRLAIAADVRRGFSRQIGENLDRILGEAEGLTISTYWPFRGEPDLRTWMAQVAERGGRYALPVVVGKGKPLLFRHWKLGDPLERGVWNIPMPAEGPSVMPDIVIAPLVGFDARCYRLGYGGGFFDRTLAAMPRKPRIIGVGYAETALPTIYPQPHDIPMDVVVTQQDVREPAT